MPDFRITCARETLVAAITAAQSRRPVDIHLCTCGAVDKKGGVDLVGKNLNVICAILETDRALLNPKSEKKQLPHHKYLHTPNIA